MKLLLVDDHALLLEGLENLLRTHGFEVVGAARNGMEAFSKAEMLRPEVILMDVHMSGCGGIEATRLIKEAFPGITIVMLTISEAEGDLFEAIRAGASGYLLKNMEPERLVVEVAKLAQGETPFAPGIAGRLLREFARLKPVGDPDPVAAGPDPDGSGPELTARQTAILERLAAGITYQEIGEELGIREVTVRYHLNEILNKLQLANRSELIAYSARMGLINQK